MFQCLAAHAPVGLFLSASDGAVTYVNARWCEMADMEAEAALGMGWVAATHPEDRGRITKAWESAVSEIRDFQEEFRFLKKDGEVTWVNASGSSIEDPTTGCQGFIGSVTDITERKRWEARMRLYEGMFGMTPDFAYVFGTDHRLLFANDSLLKMWGHSWEVAGGKTWLELGYEPWHAEMHTREMETVIRTRQPWKAEIPFTGTHGRRIYEYIFTPIFSEDGEVEAVAGTTRDVTERKQAEERLRVLSELAGKLATLTKEEDIVRTAVEVTGRYLNSHRCYFIEVLLSDNHLRVSDNWLRDEDSSSLKGHLVLNDFGGEDWWEKFSGGNLVVEDVSTHPLTRRTAAAYVDREVISYAVQPFKRSGPWTVVLAATDDRPRHWAPDELEFLENVVARVWPLVEQVRAVEEMRKSQERLALVSDNIPALVSLIGADNRFRYGNGRCREWMHFPEGKIEGTHLREVMGEEAYRIRAPYFERVLNGETVKFEAPLDHLIHGRREMELTYTPDRMEDGSVRGFFVMATDITDRKEAEMAIKRQNEGRRLLGEAGRVILNSDSPELMLRQMCETVSDYVQTDVCLMVMPGEGGVPRVVFAVGLENHLVEEIGRIYFGSQAVEGDTLAHRLAKAYRKARTVLQAEGIRGYSCRPLSVGQQVLGILIFGSRLRGPFFPQEMEFLDTLSQYVTGAHVRLRLVESLRESDRRKDQFLATLAHELRNPLAPILTGLDVMKRSGKAPAVVDRVTGIIERQAAQMVHLIDDLLDMSRVNTGKIVLKKSKESYAGILRNAIEAAQPLVEERGHSLALRLPAEGVMVDVDPSRVAQLVSNLLSNAAKYTPQGGRIELEAGTEGTDAWVRVRDNGMGIETNDQQSIFELFQQTADGSADGLGIGLTLVKSLVELHGGTVAVRSDGKGKGSEFRVRLPGCVVATRPEPVAPEPEAPSAPTRKRVLVVDDGKNAADMLALFFRLEGMEVAVAYDGKAGVEKARDFVPDLVMMDLGMPVMDGMEAARQMRSENIGGTLVALSGWGRDEDKQRSAEAGFHHHVVKPVSPDDLRAIVQRYFGEKPEGALATAAE